MSETSPALLLGGVMLLILVAIGIFVATLVYLRRAQGSQQRTPARQPDPRPQPQPVPAVQEAQAAPAPPVAEAPARPGEVMRVIRDRETGQLRVEVEGRSYSHIREIADAQVGHRVLWAAADLIRFTGGMATNPRAVQNAMSQVTEMPASSSPPARPARPATCVSS